MVLLELVEQVVLVEEELTVEMQVVAEQLIKDLLVVLETENHLTMVLEEVELALWEQTVVLEEVLVLVVMDFL